MYYLIENILSTIKTISIFVEDTCEKKKKKMIIQFRFTRTHLFVIDCISNCLQTGIFYLQDSQSIL